MVEGNKKEVKKLTRNELMESIDASVLVTQQKGIGHVYSVIRDSKVITAEDKELIIDSVVLRVYKPTVH